MRIEFEKRMTGEAELADYIHKPFVTKDVGWEKCDLRQWQYDKNGIESHVLKELSETLVRYQVPNIASASTLWAESPHEFSLRLEARSPYSDNSSPDMFRNNNVDVFYHSSEKVGEREPTPEEKVFREKREIGKKVLIYNEIPSVSIKGEIVYQDLWEADPAPALTALKELGYSAKTVTTPEDLVPLVEKLAEQFGPMLQQVLKGRQRIAFSKTMAGEAELQPYISDGELHKGIYHQGIHKHIDLQMLYYDFRSLGQELTQAIAHELDAVEHPTQRIAYDKLRATTPYEFILRLEMTRTDKAPHYFPIDRMEKISGVQKAKPALYRELPQVEIKGELTYQEPDANPAPVLDALVKLGYDTDLVTLPDQFEQAVWKTLGKMMR
ncbi:MAG: hypothetical protein KJ709_09605 [Nanoarchaeota archaeon]|nr:hypothetical protein [Nanoarchaeota archaeon]